MSANPLQLLHSLTAVATTSHKAKLRWAFSGKDRVMKQLREFEWLLELLRKLLPPKAAKDKPLDRRLPIWQADQRVLLTIFSRLFLLQRFR
jgi:hypothetical protein